MGTTELDLKEFLEASKSEIQAAVKKAAIERLLAEHRWDISEQIAKTVNEFVAAEIIPAVKEELAAQKGTILSGAIAGIASISDDLAKAMTRKAAEHLSGYNLRAVLQALFGSY